MTAIFYDELLKLETRRIAIERNMAKPKFVLILPQHFKKFPRDIAKAVRKYQTGGYNVKVIFDQPIK